MSLTANYDEFGNQISDVTPTLHTSQLLRRLSAELAALGTSGVLFSSSFDLPKWRIAVQKVFAGTGNAKLAYIGDSTAAGINSGATGKHALSPLSVMSSLLTASYLPCNNDPVFGDSTNAGGSTWTTFDPRFTMGGAWATVGAFGVLGGMAFSNSTDTATMAFTPVNQFDTVDIYSIQNTSYGTWTVNIDGGTTLATVNSAGTLAVIKTTVTATLGTHTINIQRNGTGGQVYIIGIVPTNSAAKTIDMFCFGKGSAPSLYFTGNASVIYPIPLIGLFAPDLSIIDLGINDWRTLSYSSVYDTNLQTIITKCLASGDAILVAPNYSQVGVTSYATKDNMDAYIAAVYRVAAANSIPVYDASKRFVSYTVAIANGLMADTLHPSVAGYFGKGSDLATLITV
jgi:hypothetical protein